MLRLLPAPLIALLLASCGGDSSSCFSDCMQVNNGGPMVHDSGRMKTTTLSADNFNAVHMLLPANATIEAGAAATSVTVTGDENLLPLLALDVKDGTLVLSLAKDKSYEGKIPTYTIALNALREIDVKGSGSVKATKLSGDSLTISASGSGSVNTEGEVDALTISVSGSGEADAAHLKAARVKVVVSGSGEAKVNAMDSLDATISGSGSIRYSGSPKVTKTISGSGDIKAASQ